VYNLGGRKIAFQNARPMGCLPMSRADTAPKGGGCIGVLLAMAGRHNRALSVALNKLEKELP